MDEGKYKTLWKINVKGKNYFLGSDYIGFSKNWITENVSDEDVTMGLLVTRCFAGHMLWCKGFTKGWYQYYDKFKYSATFRKDFITINWAKGGRGGIFDRIDWTLILLKSYFNCIINDDFEQRKMMFMQDESVMNLLNYKDLSDDEKNYKEWSRAERYSFIPNWSVNKLFYSFENSREWLTLFVDFYCFINILHLMI
jgi:hypothetical protein